MSYDFELFRPSANSPHGSSPPMPIEKPADPPGHREEEMPGTQTHVVTALLACRPTLQLFEPDYKKLAIRESISEAEAHQKRRDEELTDEELGLQITIFNDSAGVTIPFWRIDRKKAEETLRVAWECLSVLETEGNFSTYDPQAGRVLNLRTDFELVLDMYAGAIRTVDRTLRKS